MSKNTLFNYFTRTPTPASKTNKPPGDEQPSSTPNHPLKENSITPKRTQRSVSNGSSKKKKISNNSSKKTTEKKRKPSVTGNILIYLYMYIYIFLYLSNLQFRTDYESR